MDRFGLGWLTSPAAWPWMASGWGQFVLLAAMVPTDPIPRCVGLAMVRNEADIIEWWARYNLRCLDALHVIDHQSHDNTAEILQGLQAEGLPITIHHLSDPAHLQAEATNQLARDVVSGEAVDYLVPLDADELLAVDRAGLHEALPQIPEGHVGAMAWRTYLPESWPADNQENSGSDACFFRDFTRYRSEEIEELSKLIVPASMIGAANYWGMGNHTFWCQDSGQETPSWRLPFVLAHYPVRDLAQLQRKVSLGAMASRIKPQRIMGESWHWFQLEALFRRCERQGSSPDLQQLTLNYSFSLLPAQGAQQIRVGGIDPAPSLSCRYAARPLAPEQIQAEIESLRQANGTWLAQVGVSEFNDGNRAFREGRFQDAYLSYAVASFLNPGLAVAHLGCARSLMQLGRIEEANQAFEDVLSLEPHHYAALLEHGHVLRHLRRMLAAETSYRDAIAVDGQQFKAYLGLGRLLQEQGDLQAGELHYQRALELAAATHQPGEEGRQQLVQLQTLIQTYRSSALSGPGQSSQHATS